MSIKKRNILHQGFTLVELLAVLVILTAIMLIIIPIVQNTIDKAEESTNLRSAEFYLKAVELAIKRDSLDDIIVPNGIYDIMKNGYLCIGMYDKSSNSCTGHELKVKVINPPKSGSITIKNNLTTDYIITLKNDQIVTNITDFDVDTSCFEYVDNYDYTINEEVCITEFLPIVNRRISVEDSSIMFDESICSKEGTELFKLLGLDLMLIANEIDYTPLQLESMGVIEIDENSKNKNSTVTITKYTCIEEKDVIIPSKINNKEVTTISSFAVSPFGVSYIFELDEEEDFNVEVDDEEKINSVTIPNSVTIIGTGAFFNNNLTRVEIPNNVTTIGFGAFSANKLTSVTIPDSVTNIGLFAFSNNKLTSVTLGNNVTNIGMFGFSGNELTSVTIPNSVISIEGFAFDDNKLKTVIIGSGITSISSYAFGGNKDGLLGALKSSNQIENVYINRSSSDVTIESSAFGWADGYSEENNLHWNSTGPSN